MTKESFGRIYEDYHRLVLHISVDILHDYDLAQDVCQEVFCKLYEKIESLDEDLVKGWILKNAQRKAIDFLRKSYQKKEIPSIVEDGQESGIAVECLIEAEDEHRRKEFRDFMFEKLKEKNPMWHDLMVKVVVEKSPAKAVAQDHDITVMNLRMKLSRARHWLKNNYYQFYREL